MNIALRTFAGFLSERDDVARVQPAGIVEYDVLGTGKSARLRIEAAAVAGRPVYFRIVAPWTAPAGSADVPIGVALVSTVFVVLLVVAVVLAGRNLPSGSSDQRGAFRVATAVGLLLLAAQLLEAHHLPTGDGSSSSLARSVGRCSWAHRSGWSMWPSSRMSGDAGPRR